MELRDWAIQILSAETLENKLERPSILTDFQPGPPLLWKEPARPPGMGFSKKTREEKLPPFHLHGNPDHRAICLHRFAGHELLAVEMMAYALLAFPDAPPSFRKGVAHTLGEEQEHVRLYIQQMERLGIRFGDLPLYRHFWMHTPFLTSPLHYVSVMALTFEMANLDFSSLYGRSFAHFGDTESAGLMARILKDEIRHVRFGWNWLKNWQQTGVNEWSTWEKTLATTLLSPHRAKGFVLHAEPRREAGISEEWIECLAIVKGGSSPTRNPQPNPVETD